MDEELVEKLIQQIQDAFRNTPYPGDNQVGDDTEVYRFIGKRWQDVSVEDIDTVTNLHFFTPEGQRYYIPAYLIAVLIHPNLRINIREGIIRGLAPILNPEWKSERITIYEIFSPEERAAIRLFFESYEMLFPFPDIKNLTPIEKNFTEEDRRALQIAIEYWQMYS
jgi:hypothetical protein